MNMKWSLSLCAAGLAASLTSFAMAQAEKAAAPATTSHAAPTAAHAGDAYPFDDCPISGKKLGAMGDAVVKVYDGREVRYCCSGCPGKFEKDLAASFGKLDARIVKDQLALYPLKSSVVSGKALPEKPVEFVYDNRLVRLADEGEKAEFAKDVKKYLAALNKAVIEQQGKGYALKTCAVSGEKFGGDMGDTKDVVVAGRLIRLCCDDCNKDLEKNPAKFVAMVDAASKGAMPKTDADHKDHEKAPNAK